MRIAFYAPMKSPDDQHVSGDRTVGRGLIEAMRLAGHDGVLASRFRSYDAGDAARQERLRALGNRLAGRIVRAASGDRKADGGKVRDRFDLWFTYHLYHKAPDWLGPRVSAALDIPYVVAEASVAGKQAGGRWDLGYRSSIAALSNADLVVELNPADAPGIAPHLGSRTRRLTLPPFLDTRPFRFAAETRRSTRDALAARHRLDPDKPWLITVAMMRRDQKLASYRLLGRALELCDPSDFQLLVVGDGPARPQVEAALGPLGDGVAFHGAADPDEIATLYAACDLYVWPAVKEAFGMGFLEAQASGLPVVGGRSGGVSSVVAEGITGLLAPEGDAAAFAGNIARLLDDPDRRAKYGRAARTRIVARHDLSVAARRLDTALCDIVTSRRPAHAREVPSPLAVRAR